MKKYWMIFLSTFTLATSTILIRYGKSILGADKQNPVAIDSFVPDAKTIASMQKDNKKSNRRFRQLYTKVSLDSFSIPKPDTRFLKGLENQISLLKKAEDDNFGDLNVEVEQLEEVVDIFMSAKKTEDIIASLDAYQLSGDGRGNVKFTGYYSPVIRASKTQDNLYKHPISLDKPDGKGDNLKVVYLRDRNDITHINREGTAILHYTDGTRQLAAFNGDYNRVTIESEIGEDHDLTNNEESNSKIKKLLVTYNTYDQKGSIQPVGAAKVPLTPNYSIAVDKNYIPLGAVLLAEVPVLDEKGNIIRYDMRFLLAQDSGSAIKGAGHIDLYMGEGESAENRTKNMNKYGRVWLLLPKESPKIYAQSLK